MHSNKSQNERMLRGCVMSCGAGLVVLLGMLARSASPHLQHINGLGPSRRQGSKGGCVRCLVSLKAVGGLEPSAELSAVLIRSIASAVAADEADVRILMAQSRSAFIVDVSLEIQARANSHTDSLARTVRQKLGGSELTGALSAEGLALTAAFRADPQPFSAAGLPQLFAASDQADPGLVAGILVPLLVLLPALVFCIFHYQLIERFVSRPALEFFLLLHSMLVSTNIWIESFWCSCASCVVVYNINVLKFNALHPHLKIPCFSCRTYGTRTSTNITRWTKAFLAPLVKILTR